eukprot:GHVT01029730.1.p1 GENE.GHVT01029730.1~~GHVT01029730.1.p1  ORF type:complete len:250 (+),score=83.96 GHVT01029730.1:3-752(+)
MLLLHAFSSSSSSSSDFPYGAVGLFAEWQTSALPPPVLVDGKIPTQPNGTVNLTKHHPLPLGCVHLGGKKGLLRAARTLGLEAAPALVGFERRSGAASSGRTASASLWQPQIDGIVCRQEDKQNILKEYHTSNLRYLGRERWRLRKAVGGRWRALLKSLIVRKFLEAQRDDAPPAATTSSQGGPETKKKRRRLLRDVCRDQDLILENKLARPEEPETEAHREILLEDAGNQQLLGEEISQEQKLQDEFE